MPETILIFCTCASRDEARRIARTLVEERLAACVNILETVESIYRWQGNVESAEEVQLFIKTTTDRYSTVEQRITELHSYDTPEIIGVSMAAGSERYLNWLRNSTL